MRSAASPREVFLDCAVDVLHDAVVHPREPMAEDRFWALVEQLGWLDHDPFEFARDRRALIPIDDFLPASRFFEALVAPFRRWRRRGVPLADACMLIHHVVGSGRSAFAAVQADPERLGEIWSAGDPRRVRLPAGPAPGWGFSAVFDLGEYLAVQPPEALAAYLRARCPPAGGETRAVGQIVDHPEHGPGFVAFWDLRRAHGTVYPHAYEGVARAQNVVERCQLHRTGAGEREGWAATLCGADGRWELFTCRGTPGRTTLERLDTFPGPRVDAIERFHALVAARRAEGFADLPRQAMVFDVPDGLATGPGRRADIARELAWGLPEEALGSFEGRTRVSADRCHYEVLGLPDAPAILADTVLWVLEGLYDHGLDEDEVRIGWGGLADGPPRVDPDDDGLLAERVTFEATEPVVWRPEDGPARFPAGQFEAQPALAAALAARAAEAEVEDVEALDRRIAAALPDAPPTVEAWAAWLGTYLCGSAGGQWGWWSRYGERGLYPAVQLPDGLLVWPQREIEHAVRAGGGLAERVAHWRSAPAGPRVAPRQYPLASGQREFDAGRLPDGRQALLAAFRWCTFGLFFDASGRWLAFETREADPATLGRWHAELGFRRADIRVDPFYVPELGIGIEDVPGDLVDFARDPRSVVSEDDRRSLERSLEQWLAEGAFVLHLGRDLWVDGLGRVA